MTAVLDEISIFPTISITGSPLDKQYLEKLTYMRIDREFGLVGRAVFRFADFGSEMTTGSVFSLGSAVTVTSTTGTPVFSGKVTGLSFEQGGGRLPELVVTVDDGAYTMGLSTQTKAYLNSTNGTIVSGLLTGTGLSASSTIPDTTMQAYLLQSGTNLDFLNELCARAGRVWWVDGTSLKYEAFSSLGILQGLVTLDFGTDLFTFNVKATANHTDQVQVVGWDPTQQAQVSGTAQSPTSPESTLVKGFPGRKSGSNKIVIRDVSPLDATEATAIATSIQQNAQSEGVIAKGTGRFNPSMSPGKSAVIIGAGPASGSYTITAVEHVYDATGYKTHFTAGSYRPSHMVDVLDGSDRPTGLHIDGVITGVVTNVADPDKLGKVKVKYATQDALVESPWARIAIIGGGKSAGIEFFPQVNDEVLIAFEQGDTRRPVVLGGLYSSKNTLPTSPKPGNLDGTAVTFRRMTTPSGAMIELADGSDDPNKYVKIQLADGKTLLRLGTDKSEITLDAKDLVIGNGKGTITIKANGDIELAGENISIKGNQKVTLEATSDLGAKGANVKVEAQAQLGLKGGPQASLESSGQTAVKGSMVMIN